MTNELVTIEEPQDLSLSTQELEYRFAVAVRQRELLEGYIRDRLKPQIHYYKANGSDGKNSLTKDGAELICLAHGLKPLYFLESGPAQPSDDDQPYQITFRCRLMKGGQTDAEGWGSASSHNTNRVGHRSPRQRDIGLRHNATLKMAQKSAYIAATLNATAASEFFTQDMEDVPPIGAAQAPRSPVQVPQGNDLYQCPIHPEKAWFQKGKMKSPAHPMGDNAPWCNPDEVLLELRVNIGATLAERGALPEWWDEAVSGWGELSVGRRLHAIQLMEALAGAEATEQDNGDDELRI
jgi:hypothetical protein